MKCVFLDFSRIGPIRPRVTGGRGEGSYRLYIFFHVPPFEGYYLCIQGFLGIGCFWAWDLLVHGMWGTLYPFNAAGGRYVIPAICDACEMCDGRMRSGVISRRKPWE